MGAGRSFLQKLQLALFICDFKQGALFHRHPVNARPAVSVVTGLFNGLPFDDAKLPPKGQQESVACRHLRNNSASSYWRMTDAIMSAIRTAAEALESPKKGVSVMVAHARPSSDR